MIQQTRWQGDATPGDLWDRSLVASEHYAGYPGGYATFWKQRLPTTTGLMGSGLGMTMPSTPVLALIGLGLGIAAGFTAGHFIFKRR